MASRSGRRTSMTRQPPIASAPRHRSDGITAVLANVRNAQRWVREAVDSIVTQLLDAPAPAAASPSSTATFRIDDLARLTGTTVRNVRLYRERGLLPPPRRHGRSAIYNDSHVARLRLIISMLDRGYKIAHVKEMIDAWERGGNIADVLGVESALVGGQWSTESPETVPHAVALELAGGRDNLDEMTRLKLVEIDDASVTLVRPQLIRAFNEIRTLGIDMPTILNVHAQVFELLQQISAILVRTGAEHVLTRIDLTTLASGGTDLAELSYALTRFRTLATESVGISMVTTIDDAIRSTLAENLTKLLEAPVAPDPGP